MDADPHKPLRDDVRLLGELLGETLRNTPANGCSARSSTCAPWRSALGPAMTRISSARRRAWADAGRGRDARSPARSPLSASRQHRRAASSGPPPPCLPARSRRAASSGRRVTRRFARLLAAGIVADRLHEAVCTLQIELVLTAHPTEVARRTLVADVQPDRAPRSHSVIGQT